MLSFMTKSLSFICSSSIISFIQSIKVFWYQMIYPIYIIRKTNSSYFKFEQMIYFMKRLRYKVFSYRACVESSTKTTSFNTDIKTTSLCTYIKRHRISLHSFCNLIIKQGGHHTQQKMKQRMKCVLS